MILRHIHKNNKHTFYCTKEYASFKKVTDIPKEIIDIIERITSILYNEKVVVNLRSFSRQFSVNQLFIGCNIYDVFCNWTIQNNEESIKLRSYKIFRYILHLKQYSITFYKLKNYLKIELLIKE